MSLPRRYRKTTLALTAGAVAALLPVLAPASSAATIKSKFFTADTTKHTATLKLYAGYTSANNGYNFNGYANGKMTVTVPVGYKVTVNVTNKSSFNHSALVTFFADHTGSHNPLAFKHASTSDPTTGLDPDKSAKFTFTASKAGKYAIICAVPGHDDIGMWDVLTVVKSGTPGVSFKK